jgi:hypothetical protein
MALQVNQGIEERGLIIFIDLIEFSKIRKNGDTND